jgi:hypothetical protein
MPSAEDFLLDLDDPQKRIAAIIALGELAHAPALDRILRFANDPDPATRRAVMQALTTFEGHRVLNAIAAGRRDADESVRAAASAAWAKWVLKNVLQMSGAERGFVMLKNPETGVLEFGAGERVDAEQLAKPEFAVSQAVIQEVTRTQESLLTDNASMDARYQGAQSIVGFSLRHIVGIPLKSGDEILGVVYADKRLMSGLFQADDVQKLTDFADQAMAQSQKLPAEPPPMPPMPAPQKPIAPITPAAPVFEADEPMIDDFLLAELDGEIELEVEEAPKTSDVQFSAFYPPEAQVNRQHGLYVYAHLPGVLDLIGKDVERFRQELGGEVPTPRTAKKSARLQHETPITLVPECDELEFEPASLTKKWREDWVRFDFDFRPTAEVADETIVIRVSVMVSGVEIAHINCPLSVVSQPVVAAPVANPLAAAKMATQTASMYHRIFVSYSRKDTQVAEAYRLAQMAIGNEVFMDSYSIRVGEDWRAALARAIDQADIFQLFWSSSAAESENVRDEWDYALKYKCPDGQCAYFIRPVFWDKPMPQPPQELSHLNFRYVPLG